MSFREALWRAANAVRTVLHVEDADVPRAAGAEPTPVEQLATVGDAPDARRAPEPVADHAPVVASPTPLAETCWDCDKPPAEGRVICADCQDVALARYVQMHKAAPKKACAKRRPK